ncbi:amino acid/amide ABC transporter substrate-binding protein, HAAT family [Filimonas lacunae]|uniref:Amino acid/amide ABC transporter substrate-binding protein, HAAT family n=1 Tax=Filimonas lacunae TaxID=477680 RepID=A0A173ML95_9BACT|nr:ABC transporter substrate-binding protein [Filimonas lacunae]BAV08171.1 benzoate transport, extracellular ligand-binding receptor [Filimonas lacunae]SIT10324.1 amino acid/amide ABC transporter substrate-binding protein, HAAT family [Filimonas lacunae]
MPIRIGLLVPYSSIYPELSGALVSGVYAALPQAIIKSGFFEFIPEYVKQGSQKEVEEAVKKLLFFNQADIIAGLVSYKTAKALVPLLETANRIGFFTDMGECIPSQELQSSHVFFNSFQFWQSEYALGYWAHKQFGDKGVVAMSVYDAGYHLHSAFRQGAVMAGATVMDYEILHGGDLSRSMVQQHIHVFVEKMRANPPAYIHVIVCGKEAIEFLKAYKESGLSEHIPLLISTHMAADEMLQQVADLQLECYAAPMYNYESEERNNTEFKKAYIHLTGRKPDVFALLGYEMGLVLTALFPELQKRDWAKVQQLLQSQVVYSPRGERNFYLNSAYKTPLIDIEKIKLGAGAVAKLVIAQGRSLEYNHDVFKQIHDENVSGWQNPYLCV